MTCCLLCDFCCVVLSNSAIVAVCQLVEDFVKNLFDSIRLFGEELGNSMDSAETFRLALLQAGVTNLTDLETNIREPTIVKDRLVQTLHTLSDRIVEVNTAYAEEEYAMEVESTAPEGTENDDDLDADDLEDDMAATAGGGGGHQESKEIDENAEDEDFEDADEGDS